MLEYLPLLWVGALPAPCVSGHGTRSPSQPNSTVEMAMEMTMEMAMKMKNLNVDLDAAHHTAPLKGKIAALARDGTCRISGYGDAVEAAHLVPLANRHWFSSNNMARYCRFPTDPHPISDERNLITLRRDLHHLLDTRRFTLAAKPVSASPQPSSPTTPPPGAHAPTAQLSLHVMLSSPSGQLADLYHNRVLQLVRGIAVEFLFARFAWTLFADETMPFLSGAVRHNVLLFDPAEGRLGEDSLRAAEVRERAANVFEMCYSSRSVSPRKRSRPGHSLALTDAEGFELGAASEMGGPDEEEADWDASEVDDESDEEQWTRGRRRKRSHGASGREDNNTAPSLGASSVSVSGASIASVREELLLGADDGGKGPTPTTRPKSGTSRRRMRSGKMGV
ncbi:hypothetical protein CHGG_08906 [Chaetomium globosum CBS 148.51]|uniref:HNH nuclease domain-containing protein n=1 Tax=Chaetomium globosum (strain ATCC 6205 / CBS 148.51 / DSM 1962 / NBRC 6347 / NRRL 1970) TaxID=306901 RepID=Q2GSZ8_CHAGB|nr:uncharacterized protein CHGG_08906 [Chaetomium globosum CBS 148.51]EAQ84892.1 hypothetical protein CHGG_08906 [Chaetomium globosum CBS 148.51]